MNSAVEKLKASLYRVVRVRAVNVVLRAALKPLARFMPAHVIGRIPVTGKICVDMDGSGRLVLWSDGSDQLASRLYWNGLDSYEAGTVRVFLRLVSDSGVVLDVGANSGLFALLAAIHRSRTEVHAFEPLDRAYAFLKRNIAGNCLTNVSAVRACVANRSGQTLFYEPRTVMLPSSASLIKGFVPDETEETLVQAVALDDYVEGMHIAGVDLIKIDVEGAEYEVLEGAVNLLERDRPAIICEVLRGMADSRLGKLLAERGYRVFRITAEGLRPEAEVTGGATEAEWNYLFLPEMRITADLEDLMAPGSSSTTVCGREGAV